MKAAYQIYTYNGKYHHLFAEVSTIKDAAKACAAAKKEMLMESDTCRARAAVMAYAIKKDAPEIVRFISYDFGADIHRHARANTANTLEATISGLEEAFTLGCKQAKLTA